MSTRALLAAAVDQLTAAGVPSPAYDAAELLAHVLGTTRAQLPLVTDVGPDQQTTYAALVDRRADREPLQHLLGTAWFRHISVEVGPGVFTPRPETELLAGWAIDACNRWLSSPSEERARAYRNQVVVVDLCTGSGVIAKSLADEVPDAEIHACELDESAHRWAERNLAGTGVDLRQGDLATEFDDLLGTVDVVVSNPPYVPLEAWESVAPEARDHDPHLALFSGDDGLDAVRVLAHRAAALLKPGGVVGIEHADVQGESVPAVLAATGLWAEIRDNADLSGRPRFTTARRVQG
ncbi:peptide chain release factor N(5)-glutamine methyltransferase [Nocardioides montaniterrae]